MTSSSPANSCDVHHARGPQAILSIWWLLPSRRTTRARAWFGSRRWQTARTHRAPSLPATRTTLSYSRSRPWSFRRRNASQHPDFMRPRAYNRIDALNTLRFQLARSRSKSRRTPRSGQTGTGRSVDRSAPVSTCSPERGGMPDPSTVVAPASSSSRVSPVEWCNCNRVVALRYW